MDSYTLRQTLKRSIDVDNEVYSTRMAFVICMVLSAMLWWIPMLGPAVAGYVCGRKTGSMMKGFLCSLMSGIVILAIVWVLSIAVLGHGGYPEIPADQAAASLTGIVGATASYLQTFFVGGTSSLDMMNLGIVAMFGIVGGILSRQIRMETAHILSTGATEGTLRPAARSMLLYEKDKSIGFESFNDCIAMQGMMTNENKDVKPMQKTDQKDKQEMRPVTTTVQTVTTTVTGNTSTGTKDDSVSPFSDILERSEQRKTDR